MAKPKLALIPSAQGSKFYSVLPSSGVGDFDFTRSGSATRINSQGLIESVANGVSRLNYPMIDGVVKGCPHHILEPQRTNLIQYSEDFTSGWSLDGVTVLSNNAISPDGGLNSDKITFASGNERLYYIISTSSAVFSVYLKGKDGEEVRIRNGSGFIKTNIRLTENWERYEVFIDEANTNIQIENINSEYVYAWGAVLESGSYATSYIPTNGSTVTRSAETANGSGDAATFNDSEGVLMVEISAFQEILTASNEHIVLRNSASTDFSNSILIQHRNNGDLRIYIDGFSSGNIQFIVDDINWLENNKIAIQYDSISSNYKLFLNGITKERYSSATNQSVVGLNDISFYWGSVNNPFYGNTKQIQYFDSALTDVELETLTSWTSFTDMANGQLYSIK